MFLSDIIKNYKLNSDETRDLIIILCDILKKEKYQIFIDDFDIDDVVISEYINRLRKCEPVYKIMNYRYFWKNKFFIDKNVLDPRADTEIMLELIEKKLDKMSKYTFLDIGIGSGAILLSILCDFEKSCGVGIDISPKALEIAQKNADILGVKSRISLFHSCIGEFEHCDKFDVIVSNPPYIGYQEMGNLEKKVVDFDPHEALFADNNGLSVYKKIAESTDAYSHSESLLFLEMHPFRINEICAIFEEKWNIVEIAKDLQGLERIAFFEKK